ncbi:ion transporter [Vibrio quintilis]|uniref:Cyclic nucleotide-gated potassium channel n=1 Tax=Vibrio quintilis TaxID=1117707 RepID=A0A1M7YTT0_9VIBR|nr:ion transporter [Vibrio quintilis]SHO55998.1 Cyclic nucleotide-gated potassium channel [Vibrio quintilis]
MGTSIKNHLYVIIFGTHTKGGKIFDLCLIVTILSSLFVLVLESIPDVDTEWHNELRYLEYLFTFLFTAEYLLRLYCSPRPFAYAKSFYGVIDLLAILPTYLSFLFPGISFMGVIRLLRVMRIFRILKLVRYLQDSNILLKSLLMARRKILIFFSTVTILVTIFGALIYMIEGPEHGFTSIPTCIYWAIVTITTVGYGDVVPQTPLGQAVASLTMLLGYSIIAVPTGIITAELNREMNTHRQLVKCPNCSLAGHESDALYCKHCGSQLADPDKRVVPATSHHQV